MTKFRRIAVSLVEGMTWVLFGVAVFLLARQTWFAVQGAQPDYGSQLGATIVAGIVTLTWLAMLGRIVLQLDRSLVDWGISFALLVTGVAVDVAVALSVVFGWRFPSHLALLVIVAHVVAHVVQWVVMASQQALARFNQAYVSPEDRLTMLEQALSESEQQNAALERANTMLEEQSSKLEARLERAERRAERAREEADRGHTADCDYPGCGWSTEKHSRDAARRSLAAHKGMKHPDYETVVTSANGHG